MPQNTQETPCEVCHGEGVIEVDDLTSVLCNCTRTRLMRAHLGPEIAPAAKLRESPLFIRSTTPKEAPVHDRTQENIFLKGYWQDLLPHFRFALICKGLMFRFKVITDERIKNVFVGNESAKVRSREEREHEEVTNALSDLVSDHHLLVIRLGFLGHKNIAMPGALKEALMIREVQHLATWIVETPDSLFVPGHRAYSDEVSDYINSHFAIVDLTDQNRTPTDAPRGIDLPRNLKTVQEKREYVEQQPRFEQPPEDAPGMSIDPEDIDSFMGGNGGSGSKKKFGKFKPKKAAGGGPV